MTNANDLKEELAVRLRVDEGVKLKLYYCSENKLTIGVGHNLEAKGISTSVSNLMLDEDMDDAIAGSVRLLPSFNSLSTSAQVVLCSMVFQMGEEGVSKFVKMLHALELQEYKAASIEMLDSLWARQTPNRAQALAKMMRDTPR